MRANLERISGCGDGRARDVLAGLPDVAGRSLTSQLPPDLALALGRYGIRQVSVALRRRSLPELREALLASALADAADPRTDSRDVMVGLALHHVVARELDADPAAVFAEVARRLGDSPVAELLRQFGAREDVTLAAFGWSRVSTPSGPDFAPAP